MSDNEHSLPILGNPEVFAVKHLPFDMIPQFIQDSEDCAEGSPLVVAEDSLDILKEQ